MSRKDSHSPGQWSVISSLAVRLSVCATLHLSGELHGVWLSIEGGRQEGRRERDRSTTRNEQGDKVCSYLRTSPLLLPPPSTHLVLSYPTTAENIRLGLVTFYLDEDLLVTNIIHIHTDLYFLFLYWRGGVCAFCKWRHTFHFMLMFII